MIETSFTPLASLLGGAVIGAAAVMLMAFEGRIAGISGILSRLLPPLPNAPLRAASRSSPG
ncbi:Sulphur transport domain-containing protein OS=Bosea thiooxidans OX=53254 GN=ARD30_15190 PE=3 SV=1 [Bosea thiooxidans]